MKKSGLFIVFLCLCLSAILNAANGIIPGTGTETEPYLIEDLADFDYLVANFSDYNSGQYIRLETDIDLSGRIYTNYVIYSITSIFDGHGHTISNPTINTDGSVTDIGFAGRIDDWFNGFYPGFRNLNLQNVTVNGNNNSENVGGLCGLIWYGNISNCIVTGSVNGYTNVGLLAGSNDGGTISNCSTSGTVSGFKWVGGLIGCQVGNTVGGSTFASCSSANVSGSINVGGFVGQNDSGYIVNSYASGNVTGINSSAGLYCIGGFCGYNGGRIGYSYSSGLVSVYSSAAQSIGGFCGYSQITPVDPIYSCFWDTDTSATTYPGDNITGATGMPTDDMTISAPFVNAGWSFADGPTYDGNYPWLMVDYPRLAWENLDIEFVLVPDVTGMTQTEAEQAIENAGFIFGSVSYAYSNTIAEGLIVSQTPQGGALSTVGMTITIVISKGKLLGGGDGSEANPYLIENINDFYEYCSSSYYWRRGAYTRLECDLDLSEAGTYNRAPIAFDTDTDSRFDGTSYAGNFDGNGHIISNLSVNSFHYCGLFGKVISGGSISNLGLEKTSVSGSYYVAGLVGYNDHGSLYNCHCMGDVIGESNVGGLVGYSYFGGIDSCYLAGEVRGSGTDIGGLVGSNWSGNITNCYSDGIVTGESKYVGGIVGENRNGEITNCYSTGTVSGSSVVGGLVGTNYSGSIASSYSASMVRSVTDNVGGCVGINIGGSVVDCYYYVFNGGDNGIGIALSDEELTKTNSFAGFDFVGNDADGTEDIWDITPGYMPRLFWQSAPGCKTHLSSIQTTLDGTGYSVDPFLIGNYSDLQEFRDNKSLRIGNYKLTADIDLSGVTYTEAFVPDIFNGTFDGDGHAISHLTISGGPTLGFFSQLNGSIDGLGLDEINIIGSYSVGGLCGMNYGGINKCCVTGTITGSGGLVGGLCGENDNGSISNCYFIGTVNGSGNSVGGLCGYNYYGTISNCYAAGTVNGSGNSVGGLCGYNYSGSITESYATGSVSGSNNLGGLCGSNSRGKISNCYAAGAVSGGSCVGGLCGYQFYGSITSCYATGSVLGESSLGGLSGSNSCGTISNCYSTGSVSGGTNSDYLGGLCGYQNSGTISNCYFYVFSGPDNGYGISIDDTQLQDINSFYGFDFAGNSSDGTEDTWIIDPGYMPRLNWQDSPGQTPPYKLDMISTSLVGTGYSDDPFIIAGYDDLMEFRKNSSLRIGFYRLDDNIDLAGTTWSGAFIPEQFLGVFDGNGHTISNLSITGSNYLGLFSYLYGSVDDLDLQNISIVGTGSYLGGLCGYNNSCTISNCYVTGSVSGDDILGGLCGNNYYGTISNCYVAGSVSGDDFLGGLCGYNNNGTITNCYATGSVSGDDSYSLGGLCGYNNNGTITNCYATGSFYGDRYLGGLCGNNNYGTISNCYATGSVYGDRYLGGLCGYKYFGSISSCFWDVETSGIGNSGDDNYGAIGKTTAQMQDINTYLNADWDFVSEFANGTEDHWHMPYNATGYPMLSWQKDIPGDLTGSYGVDITDFAALSNAWLDGYDISDLQTLAQYWLEQ